jgi:hypothetical protein
MAVENRLPVPVRDRKRVLNRMLIVVLLFPLLLVTEVTSPSKRPVLSLALVRGLRDGEHESKN